MSTSTRTTERIEQMHHDITATVIDQIQLGIATGNWSPPWAGGANIWSPTNPVTGKRYTGGNRFNLGLMSMLCDDYSSEWATFKQWASLSQHTPGCIEQRTIDADVKPPKLRRPERSLCTQHGCKLVHVTQGETGTMALRPNLRKITDKITGEITTKLVGWFSYTVFNSQQVTGYDTPAPAELNGDTLMMGRCDDYLERTGATLAHLKNGGASFSPTEDVIYMPAHYRWDDAAAYWSTAVHELIHWTGHPTRQDRPAQRAIVEHGTVSKPVYGFEELVAELGCAFHLADLGISASPRDDHFEYLAGWLKLLNEDSEALWKAAVFAEQASNYIARRHATEQIKEAIS